MLYPLKFKPIFKSYVWGGKKLPSFKNITVNDRETISESWELSAIRGNVSVVANGFLKGNNLQELIEIYMGELVGDHVYDKYGIEFPLLFKFIDAAEQLSVQVHPGDEIALKRHKAYGKEEMWYIIEAENNAEICMGFNQQTSKDNLVKALENNSLTRLLNFEKVKSGDVFEVPPGRIHSIGGGTFLAEIQETSDITYRIYDWGRELKPETARDMHIDLALDIIDYTAQQSYKTQYKEKKNGAASLCENSQFKVNLIDCNTSVERDYSTLDSFVVLMCIEGSGFVVCNNYKETYTQGETILIPAIIDEIVIIPDSDSKLLEVSK